MEFENLQRVLNEYGKELQDLYKQKLLNDDAKATGNLINSVKYLFEHRGNTYAVSIKLMDYWKYIEYGRKPGKFPPFNAIKKWIEVKPVLPRPYNGRVPTINQLTYLICRKIEREGIKARNVLERTLEQINAEYEDKISEALTLDLSDAMDDAFALIVRR